jgi:hypothetical protein
MTEIFISHAVADKALADKFVGFLKEAIGVPAKAIFCSSIEGHDIPLGDDFNVYMKEQIQEPKLVILLMTPRYMESWFCLMELGATWALSNKALPIVVPPVKFNAISSTLGLKQGWSIDNHSKLIDLRIMIQGTGITLEPRTEHDWEKKRTAWKADLSRLLKNLAKPTSVTIDDHEAVKAELEELRSELGNLQEVYREANEIIEELKAAKDPAAVKAIMQNKGGFDPEKRFDELMKAISDARPQVSIYFYRNLIMDRYGKAAAIDWSDLDQKTNMEAAIQYKIAEPDFPYAYLWNEKKLKRVSSAVKELEQFLESEEATDFIKEREDAGKSMDCDDLEFWEDNLR